MTANSRSLFNLVFGPAKLRVYVWASLVSQILIVVTGAAVRLTGSGLGCPTWPTCTQESLVAVPEMGVHGVIEFANRTLTFVLAAIALLTFITVKRLGVAERKGLVWTSFSLGMGIVAQAILGGITVLTQLTWWVVGLHFVVSAVLIAVATILVWNFYRPASSEDASTTSRLAWPIFVSGLLTVLAGIVVTGAGPHAGDIDTPRSGFDLEAVQHYHSYPAYLMLALILVSLFGMWRKEALGSLAGRIHAWLLAVAVAQAVLGVAQARLGVPPLLVGLHMLGAATLVALLTAALLSVRSVKSALGR